MNERGDRSHAAEVRRRRLATLGNRAHETDFVVRVMSPRSRVAGRRVGLLAPQELAHALDQLAVWWIKQLDRFGSELA